MKRRWTWPAKHGQSMKPLPGLIALMLIAGCAMPPPGDCVWVQAIAITPEDQLADSTARQILAHNLKVESFCR